MNDQSQRAHSRRSLPRLVPGCEACICPTTCDCENPDPKSGAALVSMECPIHNFDPYPSLDCPIHGEQLLDE